MFTKKTTQIFAENKVVNKSRRLLSDAASLASYYLQPISTSITIFFNISDSKYREAELIVSACGHVLFILLLIVNIVFSVGVAFRHFRLFQPAVREAAGDLIQARGVPLEPEEDAVHYVGESGAGLRVAAGVRLSK